MEVNIPPELEAKLNQKAAEQGRDGQSLVWEAVERLVDHDEWFLREVEKGLAAADRGEFVEHEEVGKRIDCRYPGLTGIKSENSMKTVLLRLRDRNLIDQVPGSHRIRLSMAKERA